MRAFLRLPRFLVVVAVFTILAGCSQSTGAMMMPESPNVGAACDETMGCTGGLACAGGEFLPGGYCTAFCDTNACPEGSVCNADFGASICLAACNDDSECRDGYQCFGNACRVRCIGNVDCGATAVCNADGHCEEPECTSNEQCAEGLTCVSGGRCESVSVVHNEGEACTLAEPCSVGLLCLMASEGGTCARACGNNADCNSFDLVCAAVPLDNDFDSTADVVGTACLPSTVSGAFVGGACSGDSACDARLCVSGECVIPCREATDCLAGQSCVARQRPSVPGNFFGCGFPDLTTGGVEYLDIPLGMRSVPGGFLESEEILFGVPVDAVSVTLMARPATETNDTLAFFEVQDPNRTTLFDLPMIYDYVDQPERWFPDRNGGMISMLIPNSTPDRVSIRNGRYSTHLTVLRESTDAMEVEVFARVKRAPSATVASGTLDLNIYCVTPDLGAASAASNGRLQDALVELRRIYATVGITIGDIQYWDVTTTQRSLYAVIDTADEADSELDQLFEVSAGQTNNALNVFIVDRIDAMSGRETGITLGIAGGIPGAGYVHGTNHSGVAVSFSSELFGNGGEASIRIAQTMAHEIGHFLGLFHNSEAGRACAIGEEPTMEDPCAPFAGGDVISDTTHADMTNLMYWSAMDGTNLSAGQSFVMLRNVLVH